ncbi:flagellar basal-body rod protein FlgG [Anaerocolumna aminovalerica]|uniref:Flagellar basal-body rod protein FlgG n=1 Tax=Anaerocolumna aminovalerica TaxID=1527 RepID=A0A1I5HL47_9FIRM|nr:flagellar basal-body rod protein FlgF [Anaerocolumna aminovalerica]SFO48571.1 flagellar basal-body rod protein FlgG [Anaerocolumna aminovalerica]
MVRGLYTAWTGMANEQKRLDIISNNLANAATVGYKQDNVTTQSFDDVLTIKIKDASELYHERPIGKMNLGVKLGEVYTNFEQGSLRETGNTFDIALEGKGFFQVAVANNNGNEQIFYTRDGSFTMTHEGNIVDMNGNRLIGEGGNISVPVDASDIVIDRDGSVYADGVLVDKILITDFEDYNYLKKYGENMYSMVEGGTQIPAEASVHQGFTEQSNVNVVSEMVNMIAITRAYEANQKVIQTVDSTLDQAVNSVGKV